MKIAYIVPSLANTGPIIVVQNLVNYLISKVEMIHIYYFDDNIKLDFPCETIQISTNQIIDFDKYDIIHAHMFKSDRYVFKNKKYITKAITVTTIHQNILITFGPEYNFFIIRTFYWVWKKYINSFDYSIPISNHLYNTYVNDFSNITSFIHNGLDLSIDPEKKNITIYDKIISLKEKGFITIGSYTSMKEIKRLDQLLYLAQKRLDVAVVLIGEGKIKKKLELLAKKLNVSDRVFFFPYIIEPYNSILEIDAYAMSSREEAFGLAMIEAALIKIPILCTDIPIFREIFDDNSVSFFNLDDTDSMSLALNKCLSNKDIYTFNAYQRSVDCFSTKIMGENYLRFYKEILKKKHYDNSINSCIQN